MMDKKEKETFNEMFANIRGRVLATIENQIVEFKKENEDKSLMDFYQNYKKERIETFPPFKEPKDIEGKLAKISSELTAIYAFSSLSERFISKQDLKDMSTLLLQISKEVVEVAKER